MMAKPANLGKTHRNAHNFSSGIAQFGFSPNQK